MITSLLYRQQPLRITLVIGLVLLIIFKVMAPVFKASKVFGKEITMAVEPGTDKTEKEADTDQYSKNKEYNSIGPYHINEMLWYTPVAHISPYSIDYKSSYYYKITIPPPDFCEHNLS